MASVRKESTNGYIDLTSDRTAFLKLYSVPQHIHSGALCEAWHQHLPRIRKIVGEREGLLTINILTKMDSFEKCVRACRKLSKRVIFERNWGKPVVQNF